MNFITKLFSSKKAEEKKTTTNNVFAMKWNMLGVFYLNKGGDTTSNFEEISFLKLRF